MEEHKELSGSPSESLDKDNVPLSTFIARRKKEKKRKKKRSRGGDDGELLVSPSKKGAHGENDVRDGSVVVVNDGGESCEQDSGLVKSGEDGEFSENKLVGAGMGGKRSRMDVFEYTEDDLFDYKRMKKECGDREGSDVGRSDALGSKSLKTSGKWDESETGRESGVTVYRNGSSSVDPDADFVKNDGLTMDEDASFHPVSPPREKLRSPCEKSIRLQGKNGVLKLMISNKKVGGPERSHGYDEAEENRTGYSSAGNSSESTRFLRNRRSIVLMEKSKLNLQAISSTQKSRVHDWRPEDSDTSILLGSTEMGTCDSKKGHGIERDSTLTSEICLPAKHMGAEVSRGVGTEKQLLREQIRKMLVKAGWEIDFRPRTGKNYNDAVYTDPTGREHWSILNAYYALQKQSEDEEAEGNYSGAYAAFSSLPEEVLSMLTRRTRKKIERENRMKKKSRRGSCKAKEAAQRKCGKNKFSQESNSSNTNRGKLNFLIKNKCKSLKVRNGTNNFVGLNTKGSGKLQKSTFLAKKVVCNSTSAPDKVTGKLTRVHKPSLASSAHLSQARKSKKPSGCTLLVRSSKKGAYPDVNGFTPYAGKRTILSWMIDSGTVPLSGKVQYMNKRRTRTLLEGWVTRDGIHCSCCSKILTVLKFEIHAGSKLRQPFQNIYVEAGISLLQCQINTWNKQEESERSGFSSIDCNGDDPNDDTCGICGDGGDLICCDGCPSTFHQSCVDIKVLPTGDWHCSNCSCKFCGLSGDNGVGNAAAISKLFTCSSCEGKYHQPCTVQTTTDIASFCGQNCEELFKQLQKLLWVKHELEAGFSWTLIQRCDLDSDTSPQWLSQKAECNSKLAVALKVMDECFFPIIDRRSGLNLIHNVLYNFGSNFNRLNYSGFYTAILERGDEIISAASIRIHGNKLAEMPFIGTRHIYRRQGMCRRLLSAIELALCSLKVEKLIIPAISELMHTWTMAFGFSALDESHKQVMRSMNLLVFPGTAMLQKVLLEDHLTEGNAHDGSVREGSKLDSSQPITCEVKEKSPYSSLRPDRSASDEHTSLHKNRTNDNGFAIKATLGTQDGSNVEKWMRSMLKMEFFGPCTYHQKIKKNESKFFCIDCVLPICCHCLPDHAGHQYIQIRRYVHRDVIKLKDMQQFFDCSSICAYYTNGEKVLFINPRPLASQARRQPGSGDCGSCGRTLQDSSLYCSIACKVSVLDNLRDLEPVSTCCLDSSSIPQTTNGSHVIHNSDMDIHDTFEVENKPDEVSFAVPNGSCPEKSIHLSNEGLNNDNCEVKTEGAGVQDLYVSGVSCLPCSSDSGTRLQDATVEQVLEVSNERIGCPSQEGSGQPFDTSSKSRFLGSRESLLLRDSKLLDKIDECALDKGETLAGASGVKNEVGPAEHNPQTLSKVSVDCSSEGDDKSDECTSGELLSNCGKSSSDLSLLPASGADEHGKPSVTDDSCVDKRKDGNVHSSSQASVLDIHKAAEFSSVNPSCEPSVYNALDTASESHCQGISEATSFCKFPSRQEPHESDENGIPCLKDDVATFQSNVLDDNSKEDVAMFKPNSVGENSVHETSEDIAKSLNKVA